jgi:hypothetical protein
MHMLMVKTVKLGIAIDLLNDQQVYKTAQVRIWCTKYHFIYVGLNARYLIITLVYIGNKSVFTHRHTSLT